MESTPSSRSIRVRLLPSLVKANGKRHWYPLR